MSILWKIFLINIVDIDKFTKNCSKGLCYKRSPLSSNCNKEYKVKRCFEKYQKSLERNIEKKKEYYNKQKNKIRIIKKDEEWDNLVSFVKKRDRNACRLISNFSEQERKIFYSKAFYPLTKIIDVCHYISRGSDVRFKYNYDNCVLLNRQSHNWLDQYFNPLTGEKITIEEWNNWWEIILGKDLKEKLDNLRKSS